MGIKERTLAEEINNEVTSGYRPSKMAEKVVGRVSSNKFNRMMSVAKETYNKKHDIKVFLDD